MTMCTDREANDNIYNELVVDYLPALTKQHDLMLSNIYIYQSQTKLYLIPTSQAWGIGQQTDVLYNWRGSNNFHL